MKTWTTRARRGVLLLSIALVSGCATHPSPWEPAPAWEQPVPPPVDRPVVQPGAVARRDLENGLRVLVYTDRRLPRVSVALALRHGSAVEPPERAGAVSFMAELLERGAGDRDALAFAEAVDSLGASFGSSADWDSVGVAISGLSRDFDTILDLVADAALRPRFDAREAERARDALLAGLERAKDDPATLSGWWANRAIYGSHRYALPVQGTPDTVAELDAAIAREMHGRLFVPNDAIVSVCGDVDPERAIAAVRERFGGWGRGEVVDPGAPPPAVAPPARKLLIVDRPDLGQVRIVVAQDGISRTDEERIPLSLFNLVLGGSGFSSRLMAALRGPGLTYGAGSSFSLRRAPGPFFVSTFTRVEELRPALDILLAELERARTDPPTEEELSWARTLATGSFAMGLETSEAVTQALVDLDVYGLPEDSLDTYRGRVRSVTVEEVAEDTRAHLHPERAAIVLVGPAEQITPQLEGMGPYEVVEP